MNATTQIPTTENESWGFFGTMGEHAEAAWPLAMTAISDATGEPLDSVRDFLDSAHGRHFADDVNGRLYPQREIAYGRPPSDLDGPRSEKTLQEAIDATTNNWMEWKIGRSASKAYGIPMGLPYLTGFVIHCEISLHIQ